MKVGDYIKVLKPTKSKGKLISKYEIVQIVDIVNDSFVVRNILGEDFTLPLNIPFKVVKSGKSTAVYSKDEMTASPKNPDLEDPNINRCINKMQTIISNASISNNPSYLAKLGIASNCIVMAGLERVPSVQKNRLISLSMKLLNETE